MFLATSISGDTSPQKDYGFRYTLPTTATQTAFLDSRTSSGSFHSLSKDATLFIGGDPFYPNNAVNYWLQRVRIYVNYCPETVDEMINLAIMETGNFFRFRHSTHYISLMF